MKNLILIVFIFAMWTRSGFGDSIKEPNVSGQFYPADPGQLAAEVERFINTAENTPAQRRVEVVIAPHAGYFYSGAVAGHSFKAVKERSYKTIVVLAPSHFYEFNGVSIWTQGGLKTPLGIVEVDTEFAERLIAQNEKFYFEPKAFDREHSLEVELPFLQRTFEDFKIVPVIMGQASFETCEALAQALKDLIGGREDVLIVVSTDLSHYHDDTTARAMDTMTLAAIKAREAQKVWQGGYQRTLEMCGFIPVTTALVYANLKGLKDVEILKYANSGDITEDKERVVGYSAAVIYAADKMTGQAENASIDSSGEVASLNNAQKKRLLEIARRAIEEFIRNKKTIEVNESDPRLNEHEGAFVTIHRKGLLRGCIGHVIGDKPLYVIVRDMAIAAATDDPRFPPMAVEELKDFDVEVSVLSKPRPVKDPAEIQMGVHGVILSRGPFRGLFLPQVATETGWSREKFLSELCGQKAGLPADCWKDPATRLDVFTADVFDEHDVP